MSNLIFILILISLINIFLYEFFFKNIEGATTRREPKNDCSSAQVKIAMKQQETIDDLEGKLQRFELKIKDQHKNIKKHSDFLETSNSIFDKFEEQNKKDALVEDAIEEEEIRQASL